MPGRRSPSAAAQSLYAPLHTTRGGQGAYELSGRSVYALGGRGSSNVDSNAAQGLPE